MVSCHARLSVFCVVTAVILFLTSSLVGTGDLWQTINTHSNSLEPRDAIPEPQNEHRWLQKLVGQWTVESECDMGPGEPLIKNTGRETVRSFGGLRTIGEGTSEVPGGGAHESIMTLGYDPQSKQFVGTIIASAMTHLWPYHGSLDAAGKVLTLNSEGPSFSGNGTMSKYQDIITFVTDDYRTLTAQVQNADGSWQHFMTAHDRRTK